MTIKGELPIGEKTLWERLGEHRETESNLISGSPLGGGGGKVSRCADYHKKTPNKTQLSSRNKGCEKVELV